MLVDVFLDRRTTHSSRVDGTATFVLARIMTNNERSTGGCAAQSLLNLTRGTAAAAIARLFYSLNATVGAVLTFSRPVKSVSDHTGIDVEIATIDRKLGSVEDEHGVSLECAFESAVGAGEEQIEIQTTLVEGKTHLADDLIG